MLRVVQTAAWDWAPPHMSGYLNLPPPPPQYPAPHPHGQPWNQQSYHQDPQWPTYPPLPRGPPPPPPHGVAPRAPLPSLPYGAPPSATGEPPESTEGAARPIHRCGTDQEGAWAAAEPTRPYILRCGFECVVCTEP